MCVCENVSCETRSLSAVSEDRLRSLVHRTFDLLKEQSDVPSKVCVFCVVVIFREMVEVTGCVAFLFFCTRLNV